MTDFIDKNDLGWLMLTVPEVDNDRPWMTYIHVNDGSAYATDGKRMHVAPCKLDDGAYEPYELVECLDFEREPPEPINSIDVSELRLLMAKQANKGFNPNSETTASNFYVQNGFYGQLVHKDGGSMFKRIYVLEATFGIKTKGDTTLHLYTKDSDNQFMYASDGERSFVVMGIRLDEEQNT